MNINGPTSVLFQKSPQRIINSYNQNMSGTLKRPSIRRLARRIAAKASRPAEPQGPVRVEFESGEVSEQRPGTTVLHAAIKMDVSLPHYCGGHCSCGSCRIVIIEGAENLSRPQGREEMVLGPGRIKNGERLGCQARILGPVRIRIPDNFMGS